MLLSRGTFPNSAYFEDSLEATATEAAIYIPSPEKKGEGVVYCNIEGEGQEASEVDIGCLPGCKRILDLDVFGGCVLTVCLHPKLCDICDM